ncbi:MAG: ShlB/FhaC/HecB family hemolysin secretion/activation protein [Sulfuritalea sp.]|nr:ShlB/FhaC/HecB family hemolysin secretion/activation protein [Sulfuritalea sp.]
MRRFLIFVGTCFAGSAAAQTPPDAGRILQEIRPTPERPPAVTLPPIQAPALPRPAIPAAEADVRVNVSGFSFAGNSALSQEALQLALANWSGKALSFGDLIQAVEKVEATYRAAGYFLAQAYLPPQKIKDGIIEIAIAEGRLGETRIEGESLVSADVLFSYLDRLPKGEAITLPVLERQILLINELAGGRAALDMQAGEVPGTTDLVLAQKAEDALSGRIELNNHGSPSTGEKRISANLIANSPFALGDRFIGSALTTDTGKIRSYNLRYELPLGGDGWRLTAGASRAEYSLGGAFTALGASGTADAWRLGAAYPWIRSRDANLRFQIEVDQTALVDSFQASSTTLDKKSRGITFSANGDSNDDYLGGGGNRLDLTLRVGELRLGNTAAALDANGTDGRFSKLTLAAQRQQTLSPELSLQVQLSAQVTGKNLDSSEKLSLGGPTSLAGYANGEAAGDEGVQARLALRWQARSNFALTVFADYARLRLNHNPLPTPATNHKRLSDAGIGADWMIGKGFSAGAIVAWAGKEAPSPADNDKPRLWLSFGYGW